MEHAENPSDSCLCLRILLNCVSYKKKHGGGGRKADDRVKGIPVWGVNLVLCNGILLFLYTTQVIKFT